MDLAFEEFMGELRADVGEGQLATHLCQSKEANSPKQKVCVCVYRGEKCESDSNAWVYENRENPTVSLRKGGIAASLWVSPILSGSSDSSLITTTPVERSSSSSSLT